MHLDPGTTNACEIVVFAAVGCLIIRELKKLIYTLETYAINVGRLASNLAAPPSAGVSTRPPVQQLNSLDTGEAPREATFHFPASMMPWTTSTEDEE